MNDTTIRVIVQCRHRFFREGLASLLSADDIVEMVTTAVSVDDLELQCADNAFDVAIVDLVDASGDELNLPVKLEERHPGLRCVALCPDARMAREARRAGVRAVVTAIDGAVGVLHALVSDEPAAPPSRAPDAGPVLTPRETEVLSFIGEGCTTWEISRQLDISRKTVENHKQRLFAKLDVQNQAHAVAVAVRRGLIDVDGERPVMREVL
jgi:DNA-binding NarL/FixJ family response regulator